MGLSDDDGRDLGGALTTGSVGEAAAAHQPRHRAGAHAVGPIERLRVALERRPELRGPGAEWSSTAARKAWASPAAVRLRALARSNWPPRVLLGLVIVTFVRTFVPLVLKQQRYYGTFDFDLGVFDQATWLLAHGRGYLTIRGLPFLGHHLNFGLYLFAPAYWLGAGPGFLGTMIVLSYAAATVVLTRIAKHYRSNEWYGLLLGTAFLFHDAVQNQVNQNFHPEKMALPFIFGAILAALHRRWRWFAAMVVLTVIWKEDLSLFVMMLGLAVAWKRSVRIGLVTAAAGFAWFVVATRVLMPHFIPGGPFYDGVMGPLGSGPVQWVDNAAFHRDLYRTALRNNHASTYLPRLAIPFGGTAFLAPGTWLLAAPALFVNLLSAQGYTGEVFRQYGLVPLAATAVGSVRGLLSRRSTAIRVGLCGLVVLGSLSTVNVGSGPWSSRYRSGIWPLAPSAHSETLDRAVRLVPGGASVAASYFIVPHLSHRAEIYTFPNPWVPQNWGVGDRDPRDGGRVDWIVVDLASARENHDQVTLLARLQGREFEPVFDEADILVLHRVLPGS